MTKRKSKLRWRTEDDIEYLYLGLNSMAGVYFSDNRDCWAGWVQPTKAPTVWIENLCHRTAKRACKLLVEAMLRERSK